MKSFWDLLLIKSVPCTCNKENNCKSNGANNKLNPIDMRIDHSISILAAFLRNLEVYPVVIILLIEADSNNYNKKLHCFRHALFLTKLGVQ